MAKQRTHSRFAPPAPPRQQVPPATPADLRRIALNYGSLLATARLTNAERDTGIYEAKKLMSLATELQVDAHVRKALGLPPAEWNRSE